MLPQCRVDRARARVSARISACVRYLPRSRPQVFITAAAITNAIVLRNAIVIVGLAVASVRFNVTLHVVEGRLLWPLRRWQPQ